MWVEPDRPQIYKQRKNPLAGVEMGVILLGAACLQIALALGTEWSGD